MDMHLFLYFTLCLIINFSVNAEQFSSFSSAKKHLIKTLPDNSKSLYCGCDIKRQGKKLVPDPYGCGYIPRNAMTRSGKENVRAKRIEWEHIVPAWEFGHQLQCWQNGGRKNCRKVSEKFRKMEADINNLAPAIGEINADRSNFRYGMVTSHSPKYGACPIKIDFKQRVFEPPIYARKRIADAYFYMQQTYGLKISDKQRQLFEAWQRLEVAQVNDRKAL